MTYTSQRAEELLNQWKSERPVNHSLPKSFDSGVKLSSIELDCTKCNSPISLANVRGHVSSASPEVIQVRAIGYCKSCNHLTNAESRYRSTDGRLSKEFLCPISKSWESVPLPLTKSGIKSFTDMLLGMIKKVLH